MLKGGADIRRHWLNGICKDGSISVCVQVGGKCCLKYMNIMGTPWNSMCYLSSPLSCYHTACAITVMATS
jgi:hypothetical protein